MIITSYWWSGEGHYITLLLSERYKPHSHLECGMILNKTTKTQKEENLIGNPFLIKSFVFLLNQNC